MCFLVVYSPSKVKRFWSLCIDGESFFYAFTFSAYAKSCKFKKKQLQCSPDLIFFLLTCHNFLLSLQLTSMRIFADKLEKRNLGILWFLCPSLENQWIGFFTFRSSFFLLDILGSASQTWFILSVSQNLSLELYVLEVKAGPTAALRMNLEPIHFIRPLSTAQWSWNCKALGEKNNWFLTFTYPPGHLQLFDRLIIG